MDIEDDDGDQKGMLKLTGNFVSEQKMENIRSNSIYLFGAMGIVSLLCLFGRLYFRKFDT